MLLRQCRLSCGSLFLCAGLIQTHRRRKPTFSQNASLKILRSRLSTVQRDLSDVDPRRLFRIPRYTFSSLLSLIRPDLERDAGMTLLSADGRIEPEIRLALTLRQLAGASYLDAMFLCGRSRSSCYQVLHSSVSSILHRLGMSGLPSDNIGRLNSIYREFTESRTISNPLPGYSEAVDGTTVNITKPRNCSVPRNNYCRKGFYSVPF
jgi:hypothetical protein